MLATRPNPLPPGCNNADYRESARPKLSRCIIDAGVAPVANWHPNTNQRYVIWAAGIIGGVSLLSGMVLVGGAVLLAGALMVWLLSSGKRPEKIAVKTARCKQCGSIGETHWQRCPTCGTEIWKAQ
jgi:hypothetical protein